MEKLNTRIKQLLDDGTIDQETFNGLENAIADAAKWKSFREDWRGIETAPRNKTHIEVMDRHSNVCVAYFDRRFGGGKWMTVDEHGIFNGSLLEPSLHAWRPLQKANAK